LTIFRDDRVCELGLPVYLLSVIVVDIVVDKSVQRSTISRSDPIPRDVTAAVVRLPGVQAGCAVTELDLSSDDRVWLHRIWSESIRMLDTYQGRVNERKDLMAALDFARFVQWSGLVRLCKKYACPDVGLRIDGALLAWKAEDLQRAVQDLFRSSGNGQLAIAETQLEAVNRKLDLIAGRLAYLQAPSVAPINQAPANQSEAQFVNSSPPNDM